MTYLSPPIVFCGALLVTVLGLIGGWRGAITLFLSLGMAILFAGWLQFINFNGDWPWDQPWVEDYTPSSVENIRLHKVYARIPITKQNEDDFRRCRDHNICIREYSRTDFLVSPVKSSNSASSLQSGTLTQGGCVPNINSGCRPLH